MMGIWVLTIPGNSEGCEVRFESSMDVKGERGDVVPFGSADAHCDARRTHSRVRDEPDDKFIIDEVLGHRQIVRQVDQSGDGVMRNELA
jgi:hypothetical protein